MPPANPREPAREGGTQSDPLEDPSYQRFLDDTAARCRSKHAPCGACLSGGMCDNFDGSEERMDERRDDWDLDHPSDEYDD